MNKLLIPILLLAFFLRVININSSPPAMYGDELTMAFDVKSILQTGYDQTGKFLPLNFSMGGSRPVGYGYFSMPFIWLFGTSEIGIRALSILSGLGIVVLMYLLSLKLFNARIGLFASLLAAISPWDIAISRAGFEAHFGLFLTLLGIYLFLNTKTRGVNLIFAAISFVLAMHTYSTFKLIVPIFIPILFLFSGFKLAEIKNYRFSFISCIAILMCGMGLILYQAIFINSESRFTTISIFGNPDIKNQIIQEVNFNLNNSDAPRLVTKIFYNKPAQYLLVLGKSYIEHFSIDYLFISGDGNPRHNPFTSGEFYAAEIITLFFGLGALWHLAQKKIFLFIIGWVLVAPIASALTGSLHALRSNFLLPPMIIISALGMSHIFQLRSRWFSLLKLFIVLIFLIQFVFLMHKLFFVSPNQFSRFWSYPAKDAAMRILDQRDNFDYVIVSDSLDNIEFAWEVYANVDPKVVLDQNVNRAVLLDRKFKKLDKNVYIGSIAQGDINSFLTSLPGRVMFIGPILPDETVYTTDSILNKDAQPGYVVIYKR